MRFLKRLWVTLREEAQVGFFGLEKLFQKTLWVNLEKHYEAPKYLLVVIRTVKPVVIARAYIEAKGINGPYPTTVGRYPMELGDELGLTVYNDGMVEDELIRQLERDNAKKPFKVRAVVVTTEGKQVKSGWDPFPLDFRG